MAEALSGGLPAHADYPILDPAADLGAGENQGFWFFDDAGRYALLNCHIQAGGTVPAGGVVAGPYQAFEDWRTRRIVFPLAGPDGEIFTDFTIGHGAEPDGFALGGWELRCVEPFRRWTGRYRGTPVRTDRTATLAGPITLDAPRVAVEIDVEFEAALPPWQRGTYAEPGESRDWGLRAIGVPRYEQLCRTHGAIRIAGRDEYRFKGGGIRTHRSGKRVATTVLGTSWLSARFPSGRAFGSLQYRDLDGIPSYREAVTVSPDGRFTPIRVTETPWLDRLDCVGRPVMLAFEGPDGAERIEGKVLAVAYNYGIGVDRTPGALDFCHTMTRFRWGGEETTGMMELGMIIDRIAA